MGVDLREDKKTHGAYNVGFSTLRTEKKIKNSIEIQQLFKKKMRAIVSAHFPAFIRKKMHIIKVYHHHYKVSQKFFKNLLHRSIPCEKKKIMKPRKLPEISFHPQTGKTRFYF